MSRQSSLEIGLPDADGLENIPGITEYFDPNDLKGVLTDMPNYKHNDEVMEPLALDKFMKGHHNAQKVSKIEKAKCSEASNTSQSDKSETLISHSTHDNHSLRPNTQDNTDTRSNPETPIEVDFSLDKGSIGLKRVHSEQGTTASARPRVNSPTLRFGEPPKPSVLLNTVQKPLPAHGLPELQYKHKSNMIYTPLLGPGTRHPRAISRLRESTPMYSGVQHANYDHNVSNTIYHQDQTLGNNQHTERPQYPEPSLSYPQNSLAQTPYSGQQIHGNVNQPAYEQVGFRPRNDLQLGQTWMTSNHTQMAPMEQRTFKQEFPTYGSDLAYSSHREAEQDKGTNTLALNDTTVPKDENDKRVYVKMLQVAMMDMTDAEDNSGMIATWNKMRQDKNKVEQACWALVEVVMRAYNPAHIGPLVAGTKPNNKYESFEARIHALVLGLRTQKTMCKHIMAPPYVDQLVDDPLNAITRIKNNRKVNHGKKVAIQKGRFALGEKGQGKGRRNIKVAPEEEFEEEDDIGFEHDNVDAEYDFEDEEQDIEEPTVRQASVSRRRPAKRTRQADSEESQDLTYEPSRASARKRQRQSRSMYQLDENSQMIDTSARGRGPSSQSEGDTLQNPSAYRTNPQFGAKPPNEFPNLRGQAHYQSNRQTMASGFIHPYPPTQPLPENQVVINDFENPEYTTTTDFTSGNDDSEYYQYGGYGSDLQHGDAGGQARGY